MTHPVRFVTLLMLAFGCAADAQNLPPVSIEDTLAFREIKDVQIKPDGSAVAFVTRKAVMGTRRNEDSIMLVPAAGGETRTLFSGGEIGLKTWDANGRLLYALRKQDADTALVQIDVESGQSQVVWQTELAVETVGASPDGRYCIVSVKVPAERKPKEESQDDGIVYEYGRDSFTTLLMDYDTEWVDLFMIDTSNTTARKIVRLPYEGIDYPSRRYVEDIAVSPDNRKAALTVVRLGEPTLGGAPNNVDVAILDLQSGQLEIVGGSIRADIAATWLGSSDRLFFFSDGEGKIYNLKTRSATALPWAKLKRPQDALHVGNRYDRRTDSVFFRQPRGLGRVWFKEQKLESDESIVEAASYSAAGDIFAFISEDSELRPEVAVRDVKTGATRRLTDLNPYLDRRALGKVEKLTIVNGYGTEAIGYLMYPAAYEKGKRYPLLLASYGFRGKFPLTAEWHTSFPAQTLAGQGYAVLMLNLPSGLTSAQQIAGDPRKARENEGWQVLSSFEAAVQTLVERGIADPTKLGLYGWSHGAFIVEFILAHSKLHFSAACLGEGGDYNPGEFWIWGAKSWPAILTNTYGGPMTARTAAAYLEFAPSLNVDKVNTPLLMEYASVRTGNYAGEFYIPMRELGIPAELVLYDDEAHNFVRPSVRFASMHRKVDWFNFWMLGKEDSAPAKAGQYVRWRKMQAEWIAAPSIPSP